MFSINYKNPVKHNKIAFVTHLYNADCIPAYPNQTVLLVLKWLVCPAQGHFKLFGVTVHSAAVAVVYM